MSRIPGLTFPSCKQGIGTVTYQNSHGLVPGLNCPVEGSFGFATDVKEKFKVPAFLRSLVQGSESTESSWILDQGLPCLCDFDRLPWCLINFALILASCSKMSSWLTYFLGWCFLPLSLGCRVTWTTTKFISTQFVQKPLCKSPLLAKTDTFD